MREVEDASVTDISAADLMAWSVNAIVDLRREEFDPDADSLIAGVAGNNTINGTLIFNFTPVATPLPPLSRSSPPASAA